MVRESEPLAGTTNTNVSTSTRNPNGTGVGGLPGSAPRAFDGHAQLGPTFEEEQERSARARLKAAADGGTDPGTGTTGIEFLPLSDQITAATVGAAGGLLGSLLFRPTLGGVVLGLGLGTGVGLASDELGLLEGI